MALYTIDEILVKLSKKEITLQQATIWSNIMVNDMKQDAYDEGRDRGKNEGISIGFNRRWVNC